MKFQSFTKILAVSALALSSIPTWSQPSLAQTITYFCGQGQGGIPTTFARNATGKRIEVIRWQKEWGGTITREERCQQVSARFQSASEEGLLNYITSGIMSGQKVVCVAKDYGAPCSVMLFTLRPNDNPNEVVGALKKTHYLAGGAVLESGGETPRIYIDMNQLLRALCPRKSRTSVNNGTNCLKNR